MTAKKKSPFSYIKNVLSNKTPKSLENYNQFIVNRSISYYEDCIVQCYHINKMRLTDAQHFELLSSSIEPNKSRPFKAWISHKKRHDVSRITKYYQCSESQALEYLEVCGDQIFEFIDKACGGKVETKGKVRTSRRSKAKP